MITELVTALLIQAAGPNLRCAGSDWLIAGCTHGEHREAREARDAQQRNAAARERTLTLLRAGDCHAAVIAALDTGDLGFATEVRNFCAARVPAPAETPRPEPKAP